MSKAAKTWVILLFLAGTFVVILQGLGNAFLPLLTSLILAYFLFPLVKDLERRKINRSVAIISVFTVAALAFICVLSYIVPALAREMSQFLRELPQNVEKTLVRLEAISLSYGVTLPLDRESILSYIKENISILSVQSLKILPTLLKNTLTNVTGTLVGVMNLFLFPLFFFYVMKDYEQIRKTFKSFVPKKLHKKVDAYLTHADTIFSGYFRGQMLVALTLAFLYATGLTVIGVKFGLAIGLMAGVLSLIPYVGFALGFGAALVMTVAHHDVSTGVGVIFVFGAVQTLEGLVLTPKIVGDKVGLSALATMLVLIIGGNLGGLLGMLVAIPLAGLAKIVLMDCRQTIQKI